MFWTFCFASVTLVCAVAAMAAGRSSVGTPVRARDGDAVVFVVPRQTGSCKLGQAATGEVVATRGNVVSVQSSRVGGKLVPMLFVNKLPIVAIPRVGVQALATTKVPAGQVFLLGTGQTRACDSRAFGTVSTSNLVGYTQAGMEARLAVIQQELSNRITAEKYVAGVYLLVVAVFLAYLLIHAGKLSRLQKELGDLLALRQLDRDA
jgi:hypothetical protein